MLCAVNANLILPLASTRFFPMTQQQLDLEATTQPLELMRLFQYHNSAFGFGSTRIQYHGHLQHSYWRDGAFQ